MEENNLTNQSKNNNTQLIAGAILLGALVIGGAIMLRGTAKPVTVVAPAPSPIPNVEALPPVSSSDNALGSSSAKVAVVVYEDFQCPFCERFFTDTESILREKYVTTGKILFVYRDFAFLGQESIKAAEAARCAGDQGKFWEYHDYLFTHQRGENQGAFVNANLKSFAVSLGLNTSTFNQCLDSSKHSKEVMDSRTAGAKAGVNGTPKGFILKNGKVVSTIDGAEPTATITAKIDAALK